jgi:hypothetical protein
LRQILGENLGLGEPDASLFSLSFHKEERVGERRPFGTPLSGSLPAHASRGEREPGFDCQFVIGICSTIALGRADSRTERGQPCPHELELMPEKYADKAVCAPVYSVS